MDRVISGYLAANVVALTAAISACTKGRNWQSAIALLLVPGMGVHQSGSRITMLSDPYIACTCSCKPAKHEKYDQVYPVVQLPKAAES